ncbi:UBP1-associated protein 2A-like [Rhododendron vialii]|uniref:UBP1-associated protein 2A-like n=1 Tax=Rhododendron vialii TaxID=182163 RepID=UPI00265D89F7|nr:UBP1-associated protein 2A-like [Rhododendron vialii]
MLIEDHPSAAASLDEDDDVEKLLEGFAKKSLVLLAKEAVSMYPILIESVRKLAVFNPALRKILVYGLDRYTTAQTLTSVFRECGEIEDYYMPCGFSFCRFSMPGAGVHAYILFKHRSGALNALKQPRKVIDYCSTYCELESLKDITVTGELLTVPPGYYELTSQDQPPSIKEEEPVEKVLEAFGREYLLFFVKDAVSKYPDLNETVFKLADLDRKLRQVWVTNVRVGTTAWTLKTYFEKYGEVESILCIQECVDELNNGSVIVVFKQRHGARKAVKGLHKDTEFGIGGFILCFDNDTREEGLTINYIEMQPLKG